METLRIEGSSKTPDVNFDPEKGVVEIKGRSIPENSIEFYKPLIDWLNEYSEKPQTSTEVNIQLEYFNTSSSKCILDLFKKMEQINEADNSNIKINWYYESDDEDMLEAGEDYDAIIKIPFKMIELEDED